MAKELPFFRFTASEWLNGDISLEATYMKGVFIDTCAYYWFKDCSITLAMLKKKDPLNVDAILELIKLGIIKHDKKSDFVNINFLDLQYDLLSEKRVKRQIAGALGGKKKSSNARILVEQNPSYKDKDKDNYNENYKYEKFNFSKSIISLGVDVNIATDWLKVRKLKKCANTETSFNKIKTQIDLSGLTANECIKIAVEKSWGGFESDWIKNTNHGQQNKTFGANNAGDAGSQNKQLSDTKRPKTF